MKDKTLAWLYLGFIGLFGYLVATNYLNPNDTFFGFANLDFGFNIGLFTYVAIFVFLIFSFKQKQLYSKL